jgi:excisionase family DNA binding protein
MLTPQEVADAVGCDVQHIYWLIEIGELPAMKMGRKLLRIAPRAGVRIVNPILSVTDVSRLFAISRYVLLSLVESGELRGFTVPDEGLSFLRSDVLEYLERGVGIEFDIAC